MHRKTRTNVVIVSRLLMAAIVMSALIVGAVVSCAVSAPAAQAASVTTHRSAVIVTDWPHAFKLMEHGNYWCEVDKAPKLECTYWPWWKMPLFETSVNFRGAMRWLRAGKAVTRIEPHQWAMVADWF